MEADREKALDRLWGVAQEGEATDQPPRMLEGPRRHELVATRDRRVVDCRELESGALTGNRRLPALAVHLDAAHPGLVDARSPGQHRTGLDLAARQRAGDHQTQPLEQKGAIDRQPNGLARIVLQRLTAGDLQDRRLELADSLAAVTRHGMDRGAGERRVAQQLFDFELGQLEQVRGDEIRLGESHDRGRYLEQ